MGKSRENCWKIFPGKRNAINSGISGTGKGKPVGNLGSTLPETCPQPSVRGVFEIDSSSLLEFFSDESSIAVEDAVENRGLYRILVSRLS